MREPGQNCVSFTASEPTEIEPSRDVAIGPSKGREIAANFLAAHVAPDARGRIPVIGLYRLYAPWTQAQALPRLSDEILAEEMRKLFGDVGLPIVQVDGQPAVEGISLKAEVIAD